MGMEEKKKKRRKRGTIRPGEAEERGWARPGGWCGLVQFWLR